jgi:hypothetical protein
VLRPRNSGDPRNSRENLMSSPRIASRARDVTPSEQAVRARARQAAEKRIEVRRDIISASSIVLARLSVY